MGKPKKEAPAESEWKKTSLMIKAAVYKRAWQLKLDTGRELGAIVSDALSEYLKKHGA